MQKYNYYLDINFKDRTSEVEALYEPTLKDIKADPEMYAELVNDLLFHWVYGTRETPLMVLVKKQMVGDKMAKGGVPRKRYDDGGISEGEEYFIVEYKFSGGTIHRYLYTSKDDAENSIVDFYLKNDSDVFEISIKSIPRKEYVYLISKFTVVGSDKILYGGQVYKNGNHTVLIPANYDSEKEVKDRAEKIIEELKKGTFRGYNLFSKRFMNKYFR
jgi:hypothetical protein